MYKKLDDDTRLVTISHTQFCIANRRLAHLKQLVMDTKSDPISETWGWGVDSAAILGMNVLFESIPQKFSLQDILIWLRDECGAGVALSTVELALIKLARLYEL